MPFKTIQNHSKPFNTTHPNPVNAIKSPQNPSKPLKTVPNPLEPYE
jgi:hypothetical protein